jgi:hypothetical protein
MEANQLAIILDSLFAVPIRLVHQPYGQYGYYCPLTNHLAPSPGALEPGIFARLGYRPTAEPYYTRVYSPKGLKLLVIGVDIHR